MLGLIDWESRVGPTQPHAGGNGSSHQNNEFEGHKQWWDVGLGTGDWGVIGMQVPCVMTRGKGSRRRTEEFCVRAREVEWLGEESAQI